MIPKLPTIVESTELCFNYPRIIGLRTTLYGIVEFSNIAIKD